MKQRTGSGKRLEKFNMLVKSMTETNKHVCRLLLSVILLTVTVTEVAEPLRYDAVQMAEQVRYLQKEAELYRKRSCTVNIFSVLTEGKRVCSSRCCCCGCKVNSRYGRTKTVW